MPPPAESFFHHLSQLLPQPAAVQHELQLCLREEVFRKDQLIVRAGDVTQKMYFLTEGAVRAYFLQEEKEYTDWFVFENMFMCSVASFYGGGPSAQFIETLEPTKALVLLRSDMQRLSDAFPSFAKLHNLILSQSLVIMQQNIIDQRFKTAQERYRLLLTHYPQAIQRVPLKYIASYLGVTPETLSRIRATVII